MKNKNKQTKFPVARIKKIMQKDEEVGKVAQATPVVISKALELFLGLIIEESNKVTAQRGSKKVEAYHLKHAVETTETLDFLKEIVGSVHDPSNGGTIDLEAEAAEAAAAKKRRGTGKGRKVSNAAASGDAPPPKRRRRKKEDPDAVQEAETHAEPEHHDTEATEHEMSDRPQEKEEDEDENMPYIPR